MVNNNELEKAEQIINRLDSNCISSILNAIKIIITV